MAVLAACSKQVGPTSAPLRVNDTITLPQENSTISLPIEADLSSLASGLDKSVPRDLWTIDKRLSQCVPPQRLKILGARVKVLPAIACSLAGTVTRGAITLHGTGADIVADIPVNARITARDVAGKLKGATADGSAMVQAHIRLDLAKDWSPTGTVRLHYDWTTPPGLDLLGQRITFTDKADEKLRPLIAQLQRDLPAELRKLNLRGTADRAWRSAFTSIAVNDDDPPVWIRITPHRVVYGGYRIVDDRLRLDAAINGITETFVGRRPRDPPATPLPDLVKGRADDSVQLYIPVTADYDQLEPVVERALAKRSARPFVLPGFGPVMATFGKVIAYGTTENRIAVGISVTAWPSTSPGSKTNGTIWLTARPMNAPGSSRIGFADLSIQGVTDRLGGNLLIKLGNSPGISDLVASSLEQNLTKDLDRLVGKVRTVIADRRQGDFRIRARIDTVQTGVIRAAGDGVHLPVRTRGDVQITYQPLDGKGQSGKTI